MRTLMICRMYARTTGVCDAEECQSSCLSDLFGGDDAEELATDTCDGYSALISGACSDACPEDDEGGLQQARETNRSR